MLSRHCQPASLPIVTATYDRKRFKGWRSGPGLC